MHFSDEQVSEQPIVRTNSKYKLFTRGDIEQLSCGDRIQTPETAALEGTLHYIKGFLSTPHPHLGREGDVCPFTKKALSLDTMRFVTYKGKHNHDAIVQTMLELINEFQAIAPQSGSIKYLRALLLIFPELTSSECAHVEIAQKLLKDSFVKFGLMVGEFHSHCKASGVRNPDFRPLRSPYPMLAVRHMTTSDLVFLDSTPLHFDAYVKNTQDQKIPEELSDRYKEAKNKFGYFDSDTPLDPSIFTLLSRAEVPYEVLTHDSFDRPIHSPIDFAEAVQSPISSIAKSIVCKAKGIDNFGIILLPADKRIHARAVGKVLGSSDVQIVSLDEASRLTRQEPHGISPLGHTGSFVVMDSDLFQHRDIFVGTGKKGLELKIEVKAVRDITNAIVSANGRIA